MRPFFLANVQDLDLGGLRVVWVGCVRGMCLGGEVCMYKKVEQRLERDY